MLGHVMRAHANAPECAHVARISLAILAWTLTVQSPRPVQAQAAASRPLVVVREIRIDSLLLAFGVDSARVRAAVLAAVRDARRLATDARRGVPALDVDVTVPRSLSGPIHDPRGFVRVEVGRNLMENGLASRLLWQGTFDLPPAPTWREFSRGTLAEVVMAVNRYLRTATAGT